MSTKSSVVVYFFTYFDLAAGRMAVPRFKATEHAVRKHFHGKVIPMTGESVDASELDSEGRWVRVATGWGDVRERAPAPRSAAPPLP